MIIPTVEFNPVTARRQLPGEQLPQPPSQNIINNHPALRCPGQAELDNGAAVEGIGIILLQGKTRGPVILRIIGNVHHRGILDINLLPGIRNIKNKGVPEIIRIMINKVFDSGRIGYAPPVIGGVDGNRRIITGVRVYRISAVIDDIAIVHRTRRW